MINRVMDYKKHYTLLIERATNRQLHDYKERHHILPKCMGGTDATDNLVYLTPEEHYLAHLLLVKIYPEETRLVFAAHMMSVGKSRNNKVYGWLKKKYISECRKRTGIKNPSYGKKWYHHPTTLENGKLDLSNTANPASIDFPIAYADTKNNDWQGFSFGKIKMPLLLNSNLLLL